MPKNKFKREINIDSEEALESFLNYILSNEEYLLLKNYKTTKRLNRLIATLAIGGIGYICYKKGVFSEKDK